MSLESLFSGVTDGNTKVQLSKDAINNLSKLLPSQYDDYFLFELASWVEEKGYQATLDYLKETKNNDKQQIILENPTMESAKTNSFIDMDIFRRSTTIDTNITCPKCKSPNQMVVSIQVRSADEPPTTFIYCNRCGRMPYNQSI